MSWLTLLPHDIASFAPKYGSHCADVWETLRCDMGIIAVRHGKHCGTVWQPLRCSMGGIWVRYGSGRIRSCIPRKGNRGWVQQLHPTSVHEGVGDEVIGPRERRPPWLGGNGKVPVAKIDPDAVPVLVGE